MSEAPSPPQSADLVSLADEKRVAELLGQSVLGLWEVVNNLTRLRPSRREEFRVTIFGSARIPQEHWVYKAVRDLAAELVRMGCAVITGGGPGRMWAELVEWARAYLLRPEFTLASPADIEIPRCVDTAEEAIALLRERHAQWIAEK